MRFDKIKQWDSLIQSHFTKLIKFLQDQIISTNKLQVEQKLEEHIKDRHQLRSMEKAVVSKNVLCSNIHVSGEELQKQ